MTFSPPNLVGVRWSYVVLGVTWFLHACGMCMAWVWFGYDLGMGKAWVWQGYGGCSIMNLAAVFGSFLASAGSISLNPSSFSFKVLSFMDGATMRMNTFTPFPVSDL